MDRFIILRNLAAPRLAAPFDATRARAADAAPAPQPHLEVGTLTKRELNDVARQPEVVGVARVMPVRLVEPVNDGAAATSAWGIGAVQADLSPWTGDGAVPAILDTGIDRAHAAFAGVDLVEQDFTGTGNGDQNGHGTHCAGTVFGRDVGGQRIGVARGVKRALIGKVLDARGGGSSEAIFDAIAWAVRQGAHVISMSLGFDFPGAVKQAIGAGLPADAATSMALEAYRANLRMFDALMQMTRAAGAFAPGTVIVAAAGNESHRELPSPFEIGASLPAAAEGVVSVAALLERPGKLEVAPFSNTFVQISAPGVGIVSAKVGGGVRPLSGTSMACPHVAGVACLWWHKIIASGELLPSASAVTARLLATARTGVFDGSSDPTDRGAGIVTAPA